MGKFLTTEEFIVRAKDKHGDKFDYSLCDYTDSRQPIQVRCIKHDYVFTCPAHSHLNAKLSCPICVSEYRKKCSPGPQISNDEVINRFKSAHGDRHDYSLVSSRFFEWSSETIFLTLRMDSDKNLKLS